MKSRSQVARLHSGECGISGIVLRVLMSTDQHDLSHRWIAPLRNQAARKDQLSRVRVKLLEASQKPILCQGDVSCGSVSLRLQRRNFVIKEFNHNGLQK
jgi:hypothetical protein